MNYKVVLTIVGFAIAGAILYPMMKKQEAEAKRQEEEAMRKLDEIAEKELDKVRRKMKREKEIEEMNDKRYEDMKELIERVELKIREYNPKGATDVIHCMMKYKDKNGVIYEFDAANPKQLYEVWKEKTNQLIFD